MNKNISRSRIKLASERGQSLVLAIIVMFLLVLVGSVFVLIVAHNQGNAGRAKDVIKAQYMAEAGVQYADKMLRTSELGADWRPKPDNLPATMSDHPDYKWLQPYSATSAPNGGFTSFEMGEGRFLLRVSYNPDPNEPLSKFIKIESIGRIGTVIANDPTTWNSNIQLRRMLIAYKPIGVTDYLRFITNKEKRSEDMPLGADGFAVTYGNATDGRGAPIRVNGNLAWYGNSIDLVLRSKPTTTPGSNLPIDGVEVAGDIVHRLANGGNVNITEMVLGGTSAAFTAQPSGDTFTTGGGIYRDGGDAVDADSNARSVKRLEPPIIDSSNTSNNVPRYLSLTRDSGVWLPGPGGSQVNSGRYGWGKGIYIDNKDDLQPESETIFGGYTARNDWMNPNGKFSEFWQGPYYAPPGVIITLTPDKIIITKTNNISKGSDAHKRPIWYDPAGNPMPGQPSSITIDYPTGPATFTYGSGSGTPGSITIDRNGVIYAEGNIRIHGMLGAGKKLTVVSGGTIYIEGDLLKYRDAAGVVDNTSAIALLAKDYICVNTTQFVSLLTSLGSPSIGSDSGTGDPPYHLIITPEPATTFRSTVAFGPATGSTTVPHRLFTRHAGQYGASYINMWLNSTLLSGDFSNTTAVGDPRFWGNWNYNSGSIPGVFEHKVWNTASWPWVTTIGFPNVFEVALDQTTYAHNNYLLGAFTVQPMDVRIEAIMYAQERSFFIIPGYWFNQDSADTQANYTARNQRPQGVDPMWPLFGQPLDIKLTIDGAISENRPASVSDVSEWYSKWSNIPAKYGTSTEDTAHPGDGLTFLYDPTIGWPVVSSSPTRVDSYGRQLPATPCLPVCESLIFYGEQM